MLERIVIIPTHGFGNRIRALISAKILANYLKISLHVNWNNDDNCNVAYSDVFSDNSYQINLSTLDNSVTIFEPKIHTENILGKLNTKYREKKILIIQGGHEFKYPEMSELKFIKEKSRELKKINWSSKIKNYLSKIKLPDEMIGLHIRRFTNHDVQDNNHSKMFNQFNCNLIHYYTIIDKLVKKNIKIYVSTNSNLCKKEVLDRYKQNVIFQNNDGFKRTFKNDVISSIIDFLCLSKCKMIIGTYYSSFSDEAAFINLIPKYCVSDKKEKNNYHCYGYFKEHKFLLMNHATICRYLY